MLAEKSKLYPRASILPDYTSWNTNSIRYPQMKETGEISWSKSLRNAQNDESASWKSTVGFSMLKAL